MKDIYDIYLLWYDNDIFVSEILPGVCSYFEVYIPTRENISFWQQEFNSGYLLSLRIDCSNWEFAKKWFCHR